MAYTFTENHLGLQPIATTSTVQNHPLGTIRRASDPTYGEGEFIYLLGVTGTAVGLVVKYNATTYQTVVATNTVKQGVPVAIAMSANVGSQYGWYQISGLAVTKKTAVTVATQVPVFMSATAGRVKVLASVDKGILACRSANLSSVTSTTSTVVLQINRPSLQGARS